MSRILIATLLTVLFCTDSCAQQLRLDSLLRTLKAHPEADAVRMNILIDVAKAYATIAPRKGIMAAREARAIANERNDDRGRSASWTGERWNHQSLNDLAAMDSCTALAEATARRSGDSLALARAFVLLPTTWDVFGDTATIRHARQRFAWAIGFHHRQGNTEDLAEALYWFGCNAAFNTTADSLNHALALFEQAGNKSGMAMCLGYRFQYEPYVSDPERTLMDQRRAAVLAEEDGNLLWTMTLHGNLGWSLMERGQYAPAMAASLRALTAGEEFGAPYLVGAAHNNLGDLYMLLGDVPDAIEHYRAGTQNTPLPVRLVNLTGLGKAFLRLGQLDSSVVSLQAVLKENPFTDDRNQLEATGVLGETSAMKGELAQAMDQLEKALEHIDRSAFNYDLDLRFSLALGNVYMRASTVLLTSRGMDPRMAHEKAGELFRHALDLSERTGLLKEKGDALGSLSAWYLDEGDVAHALDFLKRQVAVRDSVLDSDKAKAVALLQVQYETEKKEQQIVLLGKDKEVQAKEIQKQKLVRNGFIGGFALVALFAGVFLFQRNRIGKEKKRSEELLLNILPAEVAEELKAKGEADAKQIDQVTVLFTDFKGFTAMSEKLTAKELVADIHECFSAFDHIMHKHGIEKIKTIGDAYMAAGGLPTPNTTHALDVVRAAFEIRDFIAEGKARKVAAGQPYFEIRIGIHTGPVVAGIVGVKKFAYDIWGDTVNTASRMESSGEVGQVNISESTYALVKGEAGLTFRSRGKVQAKGKGEMEMYFVEQD